MAASSTTSAGPRTRCVGPTPSATGGRPGPTPWHWPWRTPAPARAPTTSRPSTACSGRSSRPSRWTTAGCPPSRPPSATPSGTVVVADVAAARRAIVALREGEHSGAVLPVALTRPPADAPSVGEAVRGHVRARRPEVEAVLDALVGAAVAVEGDWTVAADAAEAHPDAGHRHPDRRPVQPERMAGGTPAGRGHQGRPRTTPGTGPRPPPSSTPPPSRRWTRPGGRCPTPRAPKPTWPARSTSTTAGAPRPSRA